MSERNPGQTASHGRSCLEAAGYNCSLMRALLELASNFTGLDRKQQDSSAAIIV